MYMIILGSGRVGASIAQQLLARGHQVAVVDRDPDSLLRLGGDDFAGDFYVGEALDTELLSRAEIDQADAFIACTDNDNTNLVIAQVALRKYGVKNVVVRVFDPDKAEFYGTRGMRVVCPTVRAIDEMVDAVDSSAHRREPSPYGAPGPVPAPGGVDAEAEAERLLEGVVDGEHS